MERYGNKRNIWKDPIEKYANGNFANFASCLKTCPTMN